MRIAARFDSLLLKAFGSRSLVAALLIPTGLTIAHAYSTDGLGACLSLNPSQSCSLRIGDFQQRFDSLVHLLDWFTLKQRLGYGDGMFTKEELRATVKYLKRGGTVWYAPDQDMRGKDSVFVPLFGIQASTITATHHLARLSGAAVIPFFHKRLDDGGYALRLEAPLDDFPTEDAVADTARINTYIERMVREAPSQYLWVHKRFKTRPPDAPSVY